MIPRLPPILRTLALTLSLLVRTHADPTAHKGPPAAKAIFAGGSFWCLEAAFEGVPGVDSAQSGYTGGQGPKPDFESVSAGTSGYVQAVEVFYHPGRIDYAKLLDVYWRHIDPTRADGQFSDEGSQYRTVIFYLDASQQAAAAASRKRLEASKRFAKPVLTEIVPAAAFYPAEPEHQDYYKKNVGRYQAYFRFSGREAFFKKAWASRPGK